MGLLRPFFRHKETKLYTEDWIGLRILDEAGKVKFINIPANHLQISHTDMKKHIVPYLGDKASSSSSTTMAVSESSSSHQWLPSVGNFVMDLVSLQVDQLQLVLRHG